MAIDTPARLAICGAGPIGLEAALYARFLGYEVVVYERGEVAETIRRLGDQRLHSPFAGCRSTLGLAAIEAHDEHYQRPADDAMLTADEWRERYLLPLSQTDLIADHLRLHTTVIAVSQEDTHGWTVRSRDATGQEHAEQFEGVLDCTGLDSALPRQSPGENYYILGVRSTASGSEVGFAESLDQIRRIFAILGDRATLDLYTSSERLLR
jgi:glycine/D-amino acid oxidase-like deaminating enzyme